MLGRGSNQTCLGGTQSLYEKQSVSAFAKLRLPIRDEPPGQQKAMVSPGSELS